MLEHLLACDSCDAIDRETREALVGNGYDKILLKTHNGWLTNFGNKDLNFIFRSI